MFKKMIVFSFVSLLFGVNFVQASVSPVRCCTPPNQVRPVVQSNNVQQAGAGAAAVTQGPPNQKEIYVAAKREAAAQRAIVTGPVSRALIFTASQDQSK